MIRKLSLALLMSVPVLAPARRSLAAEQTASGSVVRVYVAGPREAVLRTQAVLPELLARIRLEAVVEPASSESVLGAAGSDTSPRAFLDFRSTAAPRVVLLERAAGKELERRTLPASSSLEVAVEEAAHVLYMALESSLHARPDEAPAAASGAAATGTSSAGATAPNDATAAAATPSAATTKAPESAPTTHETAATANPQERVAAPAAETKPNDPDRSSDPDEAVPERSHAGGSAGALPITAAVSAFGGLSSFEAAHVLPAVGGALDAAIGTGKVRPGVWVSASALFPSPVSVGEATGSIRAESFRLAVTADFRPWSRASFVVGAGGGADHVSFDPGASTTTVEAGGMSRRTDAIAELLGGARVRLWSGLGIFALATIDADLTPHRYVTETAGAPGPSFALPRFRPAALAGLSYVFYDTGSRPR